MAAVRMEMSGTEAKQREVGDAVSHSTSAILMHIKALPSHTPTHAHTHTIYFNAALFMWPVFFED